MRLQIDLPRPAPVSGQAPGGAVRARHRDTRDGKANSRAFSLVGTVALLFVLGAQLSVPHLLQQASAGLALAGILIGVPHGAVDHMVPFWTSGTRPAASRMILVLGEYLGVAGVAAAALVMAPNIAVTAFLIASIVHFGWAETQFLAGRPSADGPNSARGILGALAHGAAVVVLPLGLWHGQVAEVLQPLAPWYGTDRFAGWLAASAVTVLALNGALAIDALRRKRVFGAAQIALVPAVFATVPPIAAFAVYFGFWHALRHTGRLLAIPGPDARPLPIHAAVRRYVRHAALPTLVVAIALPLLWSNSSRPVLSGALVVLLALTFPHMRTVAALDRWEAGARAAPHGASRS